MHCKCQKAFERCKERGPPVQGLPWVFNTHYKGMRFSVKAEQGDELIQNICRVHPELTGTYQVLETIRLFIRSRGLGPRIFLPDSKRTGMPLALLQVPHGGAEKMPTQFGEVIHNQHNS